MLLLLFRPASLLAAETHTYPSCPGPVADAAVAAAKAAFQAGQASFNEADYARAIVYWEDALRRDCNANLLLLNLARAYELNGQKEQAVIALETFLARVPEDPQGSSIRTRIAVLETQIEEAARKKTAPAAPKPERPSARPKPKQVEHPEVPPSEPERPLWPLFVAGGGAVVGATGFVLAAVAHGDVADAEASCPWNSTTGTFDCASSDDEEKGNNARLRRSIGLGVGIGGAAIAAAGVVWYFLQPLEEEEPPAIGFSRQGPWLSAGAGPGFGGIELQGVF